MDVTVTLMRELEAATGVPCYPTVPAERPDSFIVIQRTGGSRGLGLDRPNVAIQSWAQTEQAASAIADQVDDAMKALPFGDSGITHVDRGEPYPFPSVEKIPRYQALYSLVAHN